MLTIGLDVHQSRTSVCVLDTLGNTLREQEVLGGYEAVARALGQLKEPFQVCYEASTGYGALYERLAPLARKIAVAHPGKLKLIFQSKKKHNRADARKLAALMHLNQVPAVHVPSQEVRSWRGMIEHRGSLVGQGVALKNQVRALLRGQGIKGPAGKGLWSPKGLQWLNEQLWPTEMESFRLQILLAQIVEVQAKVKLLTEVLEKKGGRDPRVRLLLTIPGVGMRTAEAFVAYVDDPHRFRSGTIGAYFGLVPREDSTGDYRRLGHITREGPPTVRKLLTEAGWRGAYKSARIQAVFQRHRRGDKGRRKLAIVATGHWLCRVMLAMLQKGEAFRELTSQEPVGELRVGEPRDSGVKDRSPAGDRMGSGGVMPVAGSLMLGKATVAKATVTPPPDPMLAPRPKEAGLKNTRRKKPPHGEIGRK
jgi:transposase